MLGTRGSENQTVAASSKLATHVCSFCKKRMALPLVADCGHQFCYRCLDVLLPNLTQGCLTSALRIAGETCQGARYSQSACPHDSLALFPKLKNPLNQMYVQGFAVGLASYWFDKNLDQSYILYDPEMCPEWLLDDGSRPPMRKFFENTSYNSKTRTFTGVINWHPVTFGGDSMWCYTIVFSEDFRMISSGSVQSTGVLDRLMHYERDLRYRLAPGAGAMERVRTGVVLTMLLASSMPKIKATRSCYLSTLSPDMIRLVKDYLI